MKFLISVLTILFISTGVTTGQTAAPRVISECTIQYDIIVDDKADAELAKSMRGATKTIYIKGTRSRSDLVSPVYVQSVINDSKTDTTIVLTERGNAKFISYLTTEKRNQQFKRFEGITFNPTNETKTILGYECLKVVATLKDGSTFNVFYSPSIIPSNLEYEYQFKDLQGFVLEYESESTDRKLRNRYVATKITLSPVPNSRFEIPTGGYRIL